MKFAHLADCHVGAWREPALRVLTEQAFASAIDTCITERVDFVIIAGDLFHTALPSIDGVKIVFRSLKRLHDNNIPLYFITGSHDYSPTGKTMLDLIDEAGFGKNLFRGTIQDGVLRLTWTIDEKTGEKLTGILGRANQLDQVLYTQLDRTALEEESGNKIFVFHTALSELAQHSSTFDTAPTSLLPNGCMYYAGGHIHVRSDERIDGKRIVYPGPLFPASFSELEELHAGGFVIVDNGLVRRISIVTKPVVAVNIDCTGVEPLAVPERILSKLPAVADSLVLIRVSGELAGKPMNIPWKIVSDELAARGAYTVLRNTAALTSPEVERVMVSIGSVDEIEDTVLADQKIDAQLARTLMHALATDISDGEKRQNYEERIIKDGMRVLTRDLSSARQD